MSTERFIEEVLEKINEWEWAVRDTLSNDICDDYFFHLTTSAITISFPQGALTHPVTGKVCLGVSAEREQIDNMLHHFVGDLRLPVLHLLEERYQKATFVPTHVSNLEREVLSAPDRPTPWIVTGFAYNLLSAIITDVFGEAEAPEFIETLVDFARQDSIEGLTNRTNADKRGE